MEKGLQQVREARRRRKRPGRTRNLKSLRGIGDNVDGNGTRNQRQAGQNKCHGGHQWLLRSLATGHRAIHHFARPHVVPAIHFPLRRRLLFLVMMMMLCDRTVVSGAASHRVRRPCAASQRSIQSHRCEKAHPRTNNSLSFVARGVHGSLLSMTHDNSKCFRRRSQYVSFV